MLSVVRLILLLYLPFTGFAYAQDFATERILTAIQSARGLPYNARWTPPGSQTTWAMDCSNTTRWIAWSAFGVDLPRTASEQYQYFSRKNRLKRVGRDSRKLARILRPGDFLFWENTYRPRRQPPVTHVAVYLGRSPEGYPLMVGSQSSRGVDIYRFRPEQSYGGYRWLFFFKRPGRFIAYGRPD